MSSILGQNIGKFVKSGTTYTLDHSILVPTWADQRLIEDESVINGARAWKQLWTHGEWKIIVQLCKIADLATRKSKFITLMGLEGDDVTYYPFTDGDTWNDGLGKAIQNSSSANVLCHICKCEPGAFDQFNTLDILTIYVKTVTPYDITKSVA